VKEVFNKLIVGWFKVKCSSSSSSPSLPLVSDKSDEKSGDETQKETEKSDSERPAKRTKRLSNLSTHHALTITT
jgi:hypothetical protein